MSLPEKILKLDNQLSYETVSGSSQTEVEIIELIRSITEEILSGYEIQKEHIASLLAVYERHNSKSIAYLLYLCDHLSDRVQSLPVLNTTTSEIANPSDTPEVLRVMEKVYKELQNTGGNVIRLSSDFNLPLEYWEKETFISLTNFMLNTQAKRDQFEDDDLISTLKNLSIVRSLAKSMGRIEQFYLLLRSFFDLLQRHEMFQLARDMAEECLVCGYKDGMEDVAYAQVLKVYANTAAVPPALHYCIGSMVFQLNKNRIVDFSYKGIVTSLMRLYRNAGLNNLAKEVFEKRSGRITFEGYEKRSLFHTYVSTLLPVRDPSAPQKIVDYLDQMREEIIADGETEVFPWLVLLYNISAIYDPGYDAAEECQRYRQLFEQIVPASIWKKVKDVVLPTSLDSIAGHLETSLVNLAETRDELDFTTDNTRARLISNRVIRMSFDQQDWRSYLLAMIINSDYSITFKKKTAAEVMEVRIRQQLFNEIYHTPEEIAGFIRQLPECSIVWLGTNDQQVYPMLNTAGQFSFCKGSIFSMARFRQWINSHFATLPLEDTKTTVGGIKMEKSQDDYREEEELLAGELDFTALDVCPTQNVLIVKDYEISSFPHNLLICRDRGFLMINHPVMNIMSTEWLLAKLRSPHEQQNHFSRGIWIPTETGDYVLNYLYSYIEKPLSDNNFAIHRNLIPDNPVQYDLNIIAAHGKPEINSFPALFASNEHETFSIVRLDHIIGKGKILVLFVCHSGSMQSDFLRNRISTMIRGYLKAGYEAVIAPFWALDISIARDWLPAFINSLTAGDPVIKAVHNGNMCVRATFPTPGAYACLHAYGNPFFRLSSPTNS